MVQIIKIQKGVIMKSLRTMVLCLTAFLLLSSSSSAQLFQIGAGGGLTQILSPTSYTDYYSTEWNAGAIAKLGIPLLPIKARALVLFHSLSGTVEDSVYDYGVNRDIWEIGLGAQYNFIPVPAGFDPYIALDLTLNSNSGGGTVTYGGDIGIGTEITIIPILDFDVYASYTMFNLFGKEDGEENLTAFTLDVFILFSFL